MIVLDGHSHCGLTVPFAELKREWDLGEIQGGVVFSPVEEIYDRCDFSFIDSEQYRRSRERVHTYLLELARRGNIYPYFFVWNDFATAGKGFAGIKWHRHPDEPVYEYGTRRCEEAIDDICSRRLPIVLEEEFRNTLSFLRRIAGRTVVIIPHMGALNGGYFRLKAAGVFENENVWADTALAGEGEISDFAANYGIDRIIFGSDYPFGIPSHEKEKLYRLFRADALESVLSGNLRRLLKIPSDSV